MSHRFAQLEMRRRQLLLRSELLRAEFGADQRIVAEAIGGVERTLRKARSAAPPLLLAVGAVLLFGLLKRRGRVHPVGLAMHGLAWVSLARRLLGVLAVIRAVSRSRTRVAHDPQP